MKGHLLAYFIFFSLLCSQIVNVLGIRENTKQLLVGSGTSANLGRADHCKNKEGLHCKDEEKLLENEDYIYTNSIP
ncbi:hypothetical protein Syun_003948 [Stephania yunnanensis]|uniref:Phytosulfokine-beta n=1 Tax=Stephania yunnanensis TaxID=152371 RepID=A0AAP0Q4E9_9MAGN